MKLRILRLIAEIDEFKGFWRGLTSLPSDRLAALRTIATIESIGSSTRIEGSLLSDREVSTLLKGLDFQSFRSRDEQEVAGYAEAMHLVHERYNNIDLTESNLKQLHKTLMQFSSKDSWHLGDYKKHPNHIAAFDDGGKEIGIIFETAAPFETPHLMEALVANTNKQLAKEEFHPLLAIADFILRFLAIRPFQDGNGRLSRVLTNLLLLKYGYDFVMYSSHERIVEANKDLYYSALRASQKEVADLGSFNEMWIEFFLELLIKQIKELEDKIQREEVLTPMPAISQQILELAEQHGKVSVLFISQTLKANRNTVKKHLQNLVKRERIKKHGKGRGTFYTIR